MTQKDAAQPAPGSSKGSGSEGSVRHRLVRRVSASTAARQGQDGGRVRIAVATQPALVRDVLRTCLKQEEGLEIVGEGHAEDQIVDILRGSSPDLLLFDYEALGAHSEAIIARLRRLAPDTRILVIATRSSDENVEKVLRAGASGLVAKQLGYETFLHAIRAVASGEIWANRRAQALALEHLTTYAVGIPRHREQLTRREQQIADGIARGLRNKEIARELGISAKTVKSHLNNIFQKLGLEGRFALAMFDQGQIQPKT
jgi:DNA-binding NarL/FixJ family response regulator